MEGIGIAVESIKYGLVGKSSVVYLLVALSFGRRRDGFQFSCRFDATSPE